MTESFPSSQPTSASPAAPVTAGFAAALSPEPAGESPTTTAGAPATTTPAPTRVADVTTTTTIVPVATTTTTTTIPVPVPVPAAIRAGVTRVTAVEAEVVPLTNGDRDAEGLGSLTRNACLDAIASGYAEKMANSGVLAHNPGAGPAVTGCRPNASRGDNVGTAAPCDTTLLEQRWMASPSHRRNILTGAFQLVGVGAWTDAKGGCWVQVLFSS